MMSRMSKRKRCCLFTMRGLLLRLG
ncbi:hypothetical protein NC652_022015 [Populus alba x Populus x berolinensis]|nr:hypothetical protein NC652_022015 [Populus alba x Populus x berolinensis]